VRWCHGDILTLPLEAEPFDAVLSDATLHHRPDAPGALRRLSQLVRPGGMLAIAGFTRTGWHDWPWAVTAFIALSPPPAQLDTPARGVWQSGGPERAGRRGRAAFTLCVVPAGNGAAGKWRAR
jgi:SAM-dependent methyltransferase